MKNESILVTGASGFVASKLIEMLRLGGREVWGLSTQSKGSSFQIKFSLGQPLSLPREVANPKILIHCAYDFSDRSEPVENINYLGSVRLFEEAKKLGIEKIIFLSSMSAHIDAQSKYGETKFQIEQRLNDFGRGLIVRPGFILGPGGICLNLVRQIERLPLLPIFYARAPIQLVDLDRLLLAIEISLNLDMLGELNLGCLPALAIEDFYQSLCKALSLSYRPVRLPGALGLLLLRIVEFLKFELPLKTDNLLGLKYAKSWQSEESWLRLGLIPPNAQDCLDPLIRIQKKFI
jgi:nucleoside-diphosphate-sugar epimerase